MFKFKSACCYHGTSMDAQTKPPSEPLGSYIHLHLHSEYSLLDGGNKIDALLKRVKELGMDSVAVTDHGNLFGAFEFYTKAKAAKVKTFLGIEACFALGGGGGRKPTGIRGRRDHPCDLRCGNLG